MQSGGGVPKGDQPGAGRARGRIRDRRGSGLCGGYKSRENPGV